MKQREKCLGPGAKDIIETKAEAHEELKVFRRKHQGRGRSYRCSWGPHYHVTKGLCGRKGKDIR